MARISSSGRALSSLHHRRHRAGGDAMESGFTRSQIGEQVIFAPGDGRMRKRRQRRSFPALGKAAGEIGVGPFSAERVARRMAGAAMAEAFDEIGAAIPGCRFGRIGRESIGAVEQRVPSRHQRTPIERKGKRRLAVSRRAPAPAPSDRRRAPADRHRLSSRNACRETPDRDAGRRGGCPRAWRARRRDRTSRRFRSRHRA